MRKSLLKALLAATVGVALVFTLGSCSQDAQTGSPKQQPGKKAHLVELATVTIDTLRITSVYTGSLRSRRLVRVFNQEEGRVTKLPFYEGDRVAKDQVLLELDSTLLKAELDKAIAVRREAEANLKRLRQLGERKVASEDEVLRAATAVHVAKAEESVLRTRLGYTVVRAPFSGVVSARLMEAGDIAPLHTHVLSLSDPDSLVTELRVSELLMPHLAIDDPVVVRIDALGDQSFSGRILRIHPDLDPRTRQGRVEVELKPVPVGAQAGQFARVTFSAEALNRKVIPFASLRRDRDGEFVYRMTADGRVERIAVRGGRRLADRVEILEGLENGEKVVTKGFLGLTAGTTVQPVNDVKTSSGGSG